MAHTAGTSARTHRLIALVATLVLAVTTALAFGRVFLGGATTLRLLASAIATAALAVAFERRSLLLATVASAAGLSLAVGLLLFPDTTWYGLPTAETLRAALDAAAVVGQQARIQVAPAEPIAPLVLAAIVSLWAAMFSAHALAFRAGSPLLGLIPPVALVAFADTVLEEFVRPMYGVAFLAAALLVVFADGLTRVQGWGPVWASGRRGVAATAGRGARRLAVPALALAAIAPLLVPGFGSKAVIDFGTPSDRISIDPFVSVQSALTREEPVEVLRATVRRPTYIRVVSLPDFDGVRWVPVEGPGNDDGPEAFDAGDAGVAGPVQTVGFEVMEDTGFEWLPTVHPVRGIDATELSVTYDAESGTAFTPAPVEEGDTYGVQTSFVQPTEDQLRAVEFGSLEAGGRYVELPADRPMRLREIAQEWTRGRTTVYDKARAIEAHLRDTTQFRYRENVPVRSGSRSLLEFLESTKAGFCQQFSAAMAVLLRELGIQSRVVVGFATGNPLPGGGYSYWTNQYHSWVEVYFPGWGWLPFEPTPNRQNPVAELYDAPAGPECVGTECVGVPPPGVDQEGRGVTAEERAFERDPRVVGPRGPAGPGTLGSPVAGRPLSPRTLLLLAVLLAGLVVLLLPAGRALLRRRRLRRAAAEPRRLILETYDVFTERVAGVGLGRGAGETLEEYRRRVLGTGYLSDGHLDRLTRIATAAAYSGREPDADQARAAGVAASTALREIRRAVGPSRWVVGLYRRG